MTGAEIVAACEHVTIPYGSETSGNQPGACAACIDEVLKWWRDDSAAGEERRLREYRRADAAKAERDKARAALAQREGELREARELLNGAAGSGTKAGCPVCALRDALSSTAPVAARIRERE